MKLFVLLTILALGASMASCSNNYRAIDIETNIPVEITSTSSVYQAGDTVLVNTRNMRITDYTFIKDNSVIGHRVYVIQ